MSGDVKANTLPKWSYILLAVLLVPFDVGLIWAIVSKDNVPDTVTMIASVCFFTAIAFIVHLAWPRRSMWLGHLAAFVLFFILFLCLVRRSRSLRIRHGVHEPADAGSNGQSGIQRRRLEERNARQRKSVSSRTTAPHVLQAVPCLRNIDRNRPRHGGPDLGQQWNPDKHVHDHLPNGALEQVH